MKKTLFMLFTVILLIICIVCVKIINTREKKRIVVKENLEYEQYVDKEIIGTDLATLINKAIDENKKNNVAKDEKGNYIDNTENSIRIDVKMITVEKTYPMESFYNNNITNFVENFNLIAFKCTKVEYHKKTGRISKMLFEQLEE